MKISIIKTNKLTLKILVIFTIVIIYYIFKKRIDITLMFLFYDIYSLFGLYRHFEPAYCSNMKFGFTPVMPLNYYADFNNTIFPRIPKGDNTLNREKIIKICDRNLEWLSQNGKICEKAKQIEVFHVDQPDFTPFNISNAEVFSKPHKHLLLGLYC